MNHSLSISCLLAIIFCFSLAQNDCNNPLLGRSEIIARYGGSGNILSTPATAPSPLPICKWLANQSTCVTSAGYTAFVSDLSASKQNLASIGNQKSGSRFGNLTRIKASDVNACINDIAAYSLFVLLSGFGNATQSNSSSNGTINYQSIVTSIKQQVSQQSSQPSDLQSAVSDVTAVVKNLTTDKANCAKHLFEVYIYTTCLASSTNYSNKTSGTTANPSVKIKQGYCATVAKDCKNYISGLKLISSAEIAFSTCADPTVQTVGNLTLRTTFSDSVNQQLNQIWQQIQNSPNTSALTNAANNEIGSQVQCSNLNSSDNQCNFVCASVLNATGYKPNAFNDLDPNENSRLRLLQNGGLVEVNDPTLDSPDTITANEDTAPVQEADVGTDTTTSSSSSTSSGSGGSSSTSTSTGTGGSTGSSGTSSGLRIIINLALSLISGLLLIQ